MIEIIAWIIIIYAAYKFFTSGRNKTYTQVKTEAVFDTTDFEKYLVNKYHLSTIKPSAKKQSYTSENIKKTEEVEVDDDAVEETDDERIARILKQMEKDEIDKQKKLKLEEEKSKSTEEDDLLNSIKPDDVLKMSDEELIRIYDLEPFPNDAKINIPYWRDLAYKGAIDRQNRFKKDLYLDMIINGNNVDIDGLKKEAVEALHITYSELERFIEEKKAEKKK